MMERVAPVFQSILILVLLLLGTGPGKVRIRTAQSEIRPQRERVMAAKTYQGRSGRAMPYRLFVPDKYDRQQKYPLVLYLHGGGGLGRDNVKQIQGGNGFLLDLLISPQSQARYPCLVVAPQSHDEGWVDHDTIAPSDQLRLALELIEHLQKTYNLDRERLYVAGQSLGGFGAFAIVSLRPDLFAAVVPICGGGDESKARVIAHVPVWAFHGDRDEAVSVERSRRMITALRQAGGKPKYTEYKGEGHVIWSKVVSEPELLPWLFGQRSYTVKN